MLCEVIYFILVLITVTNSADKDIYWRDYKGTIPQDAIKAAPNTYVGQAIYQGFLTPGTIYEDKKVFVSEYFGKFEVKEHIRILCTKNHSNFVWERVHVDALPLQLEDRLVEGGYQGNIRWYIGKWFHEDEWKVGKVELYAHDYKGLLIWHNDGSFARVFEFDILTYL